MMDPEEERVLYLSRVGRDKIFKYGTYNMVQQRAITQDHPFYEKRDDITPKATYGYVPPEQNAAASAMAQPEAESAPVPPAPEPEDPDALASQIISSNFKVGLSQEEVDALLNGMA